MRFTAPKDALVSALTLAQSVSERRSTFPILANVLLAADSDGFTVTATDLNTSASQRIEGTVARKGKATVNATALLATVKAMPAGDVSLSVADNGQIEVKGGKAKIGLPALPAADFPKIPAHAGEWQRVDAATVCDLIDRTAFAISEDHTRQHLCVSKWETRDGGRLRLVSVDGSRLVYAEADAPGLSLPAGVQLPAKQVADLRRALDSVTGEVEIAFSDSWCHVRAGGATLAFKMPSSEFPPYENVMPTHHERRALVPAAAMIAALRRCSVVLGKGVYWMRLRFDSTGLLITAEDATGGNASDEVPIEYTGDAFTLGVSPRLLIEALSVVDGEKAELRTGHPYKDPVVIVGDASDRVYALVMPVNLEKVGA